MICKKKTIFCVIRKICRFTNGKIRAVKIDEIAAANIFTYHFKISTSDCDIGSLKIFPNNKQIFFADRFTFGFIVVRDVESSFLVDTVQAIKTVLIRPYH